MLRLKRLGFSAITFVLLVSMIYTPSVFAEAPTDEVTVADEYEMFVDMMGAVNWTYYADGSQYEGKTLSVIGSPTLQHESIQFAISIGAYHVVYYKNADGSIPTTIEELYADDVQTFTLYTSEESLAPAPGIKIDLGLSISPTDNLTVDTMLVDDTDEIYSFSEMIANTTGAHISTTVVADAAELTYSKYRSDVINWDTTTELVDEFDEDEAPIAETYGTENMTNTAYIWLARLVEAEKGYAVNTVDIDDTTEVLTSEAVTVQYDEDAYDGLREIINEELIAAGVDDLAGLPSLGDIGRSISKKVSGVKGSFSFSKGFSVNNLKAKAASLKTSAIAAGASGARIIKGVVASGMAKARTAGMAASKYIQKASSKTSGFLASSAGKIFKKPFAFLGGVIKKVKAAVSFILRYWWVWLSLIAVGFLLFATPVGPFLMNNTIRKIVK